MVHTAAVILLTTQMLMSKLASREISFIFLFYLQFSE